MLVRSMGVAGGDGRAREVEQPGQFSPTGGKEFCPMCIKTQPVSFRDAKPPKLLCIESKRVNENSGFSRGSHSTMY